MFVLDTNVISEMRRGPRRCDVNVLAWTRNHSAATFYLSAITLLEVEAGILRLARKDAAQAAALREWFDEQVLDQFSDRILPVDAEVALRCAPMHVPDPAPERDALIAATALAHGFTVATRNVGDFKRFKLPLVNPWVASKGKAR